MWAPLAQEERRRTWRAQERSASIRTPRRPRRQTSRRKRATSSAQPQQYRSRHACGPTRSLGVFRNPSDLVRQGADFSCALSLKPHGSAHIHRVPSLASLLLPHEASVNGRNLYFRRRSSKCTYSTSTSPPARLVTAPSASSTAPSKPRAGANTPFSRTNI